MRSVHKILLFLFAVLIASILPALAEEQYVDPVFGDTIDRTAEDFVTVSLLVADPGAASYSVFGHACLRMQCPAFDMDYCFSYESESVKNRIGDYLAGNLKMGLFAVPVRDYCDGYSEEGRGVYEYILNLPPQVEQELWRILDERVAEGHELPYDYFKRGCTITCVNFLHEALGNKKVTYSGLTTDMTTRDYARAYMEDYPWTWFAWNFICGREGDVLLPEAQQLLIPAELVKAWQNATIDGNLIISQEPIVLVEGAPQWDDSWFTPMLLAWLILCLAIANIFWNKPYCDWLMLLAQTVVGAAMMYLICFSNLCCTSWNWLLIPFNPLPAIFWYWRKDWALPYACVMMGWCLVMAANLLWGHVLVDWSHILLVLAWLLIVLKQSPWMGTLLSHKNE